MYCCVLIQVQMNLELGIFYFQPIKILKHHDDCFQTVHIFSISAEARAIVVGLEIESMRIDLSVFSNNESLVQSLNGVVETCLEVIISSVDEICDLSNFFEFLIFLNALLHVVGLIIYIYTYINTINANKENLQNKMTIKFGIS